MITRHDGVEYIGEILSDDNRDILLKTKTLGQLYIPKYEIKNILVIEDEKMVMHNQYMFTGPFTTRYSFTTNALPIKKGENYGMINLYGPEAHLALTDKLNVGVMSTWIASPIILAAKYSFSEDDSGVNFSVGSMFGTSGYINGFRGYGGLHWLNMTLGDRQNNLTFSGGYAYLQTGTDEYEPEPGVYAEQEYYAATEQGSNMGSLIHGPIFSVAGIFKIGAKTSFVFDSMIGYFKYEESSSTTSGSGTNTYTVTSGYSYTTALFLMPGVRFQNTDRKAFQISIAGISTYGDVEASFPIPMCSWFYQF